MDLDALIARLQELRDEFGGDLPVMYDGWASPVRHADHINTNFGEAIALT